jgi:subtilisin-like proprotein convertase family protein
MKSLQSFYETFVWQRISAAATLLLFILCGAAMPRAVTAQTTFTNSTAITIPSPSAALGAASIYPAPITVSGVGTQLTAISVTLSDFSHTYPADVDVLLVGPGGQNVLLMSDEGTFFPVSNLSFTFSNTAGSNMPSSSQLSSGTFLPSNFDPVGDVDGFPAPAPLFGPYGSSFAPLIGTNPNGTWNLYVVDDVAGNNGQFAGGWSITVTTPAAPLQINSAVSRKTHGGAGDFDINLPLSGEPGVECRSSGGNHLIIFTFTNDIASGNASVTSGTGSVLGSPSFSNNQMIVNLTGVTDIQTLTVSLTNVTDTFSQVLPNTALDVNFLIGDTNGNKTVNSTDITQAKAQTGALVSAANFREDVNANGALNGTDIALVKARAGDGITGNESTARRK